MRKQKDILDEAVNALKNESVMAGPPQETVDAVLQELAETPEEAQWQAGQHKLIGQLESSRWERISAHIGQLLLSRRRLLAWSASALAVAAVLVFTVIISRRADVPREQVDLAPASIGQVDIVRGRCVRVTADNEEKPLAPGDALETGDRLQVGPGGGLRIRLADGSTLWLCAGTELVCVGQRSSASPTMRLLRGEIRADITPSEKQTLSIETPAATLRVLGTQFNCRLLPAITQKEDETMKRLRNALQKAIFIVTVLSGSVAIEAANSQQIVYEGQRAMVASGVAASPAETIENTDYSRNWLGEPGRQLKPDALFFTTIRDYLLHSLWAVDLESGQARHITNFVGGSPRVVQRLGPDMALIEVRSVLFAHSGNRPIGSSGRPFVNNQVMLANLRTGEKIPMVPLRDCVPWYMELSPDRRKLAFAGFCQPDKDSERTFGVFVLDMETFKLERLLTGRIKTAPHWSPDSRWLAISKSPRYTNKHKIVMIDTVTGEVVDTGLKGAGVVFSPDGKRLLFSSGFKKGGSYSAGVPTYGNLFIADLPDGKPEQITFLADGGAIRPSFCPDGSRLVYWQEPYGNLRVLDMNSKQDSVVTEGYAFSRLQWLDANARLVLISPAMGTDESLSVKLISLAGDEPMVKEITPKNPALSAEQQRITQDIADRLFLVFRIYRDAVTAQDLHRIEEAQAKYSEARDLIAAVIEELDSGAGLQNKASSVPGLGRDDLYPYLEVMEKEAAMTPAEQSVKVVRDNLEFYIASRLHSYYKENKAFPETPEELARWSATDCWQINHISSEDKEAARRLFVVPGDDPDEIITSYKLVRTGKKKDEWVIQTPVLANGKRFRATYRLSKRGRVDAEIIEID